MCVLTMPYWVCFPLYLNLLFIAGVQLQSNAPCEHNGQFYPNGAAISTHENNCYGLICQEGNVVAWDDECNIEIPACPGGTNMNVSGECCPKCVTTTKLPPTTTTVTMTTTFPTTRPAVGCSWHGSFYPYDADISRDPQNCHGLICTKGGVVAWDDKCSFGIPECPGGTNVDVPGVCCPKCVTTTPPPTSTPPTRVPPTTTSEPVAGCYINGTLYLYGADVPQNTTCEKCKCTAENGLVCNRDSCGPSSNGVSLHRCTVAVFTCIAYVFIAIGSAGCLIYGT